LPGILLEARPNALDNIARAKTVIDDALQYRLRSIEIGRRPKKFW
jgi:hypothetical protein